MLLFLIGIEPLTQKILSSTKIQEISLGSTSLKVSHYADDLTFFPSSQKHFWMKYGIYNLGAKIIPIKLELFSNSQSHRPKPNQLCIKTLILFQKNPIPLDHPNNLTFKSLYQTLLNPDSNPFPNTNTNISHIWPRLTLFKPCPSLFSNLEKEIAFKTAYKGFT